LQLPEEFVWDFVDHVREFAAKLFECHV
jgi:hypothetical protein